MSVNELQALTQKFADAFDQRDVQPMLDMLSEDVERPLLCDSQGSLRIEPGHWAPGGAP